MPLIEGRICMKFLLRNWQKDRSDLIRKPTHYPETTEGKAMREAIR